MGYTLAAHSGIALLLMETGLVGFFLYFAFVYKCLCGLKPKFTGSLVDDMGYVAILGTLSILLVSVGGDTLLRRGTFAYFSMGAFCRCHKLRSAWLRSAEAQTAAEGGR